MTFGDAIEVLKQGKKVTRNAWNTDTYLWLKQATLITNAYDPYLKELISTSDNGIVCGLPTITMAIKNENNKNSVVTGWSPSQLDMFAEDWKIVE